jgi:hypothetical protein
VLALLPATLARTVTTAGFAPNEVASVECAPVITRRRILPKATYPSLGSSRSVNRRSLTVNPRFRYLRLLVLILLASLLILSRTAEAADPIVLSGQETATIANLLKKNQVRFGDASRTAYVDPGLWYAVDLQQKKNLTILLARRLAARNNAEFSSIGILSSLTGRKPATFTMSEGFIVRQ